MRPSPDFLPPPVAPLGSSCALLLHVALLELRVVHPRRRRPAGQRPRRVADHLARRFAAAAVAGSAVQLVAVGQVVARLALRREAGHRPVRHAPAGLVEVAGERVRHVVGVLVEIVGLLQQVADHVLQALGQRHLRDFRTLAIRRILQQPLGVVRGVRQPRLQVLLHLRTQREAEVFRRHRDRLRLGPLRRLLHLLVDAVGVLPHRVVVHEPLGQLRQLAHRSLRPRLRPLGQVVQRLESLQALFVLDVAGVLRRQLLELARDLRLVLEQVVQVVDRFGDHRGQLLVRLGVLLLDPLEVVPRLLVPLQPFQGRQQVFQLRDDLVLHRQRLGAELALLGRVGGVAARLQEVDGVGHGAGRQVVEIVGRLFPVDPLPLEQVLQRVRVELKIGRLGFLRRHLERQSAGFRRARPGDVVVVRGLGPVFHAVAHLQPRVGQLPRILPLVLVVMLVREFSPRSGQLARRLAVHGNHQMHAGKAVIVGRPNVQDDHRVRRRRAVRPVQQHPRRQVRHDRDRHGRRVVRRPLVVYHVNPVRHRLDERPAVRPVRQTGAGGRQHERADPGAVVAALLHRDRPLHHRLLFTLSKHLRPQLGLVERFGGVQFHRHRRAGHRRDGAGGVGDMFIRQTEIGRIGVGQSDLLDARRLDRLDVELIGAGVAGRDVVIEGVEDGAALPAEHAGRASLGPNRVAPPIAARGPAVQVGAFRNAAVHDGLDREVLALDHARHRLVRLDRLNASPRVRRLVGERQQHAGQAGSELRREGRRIAADGEDGDQRGGGRAPGRPAVDAVAHVHVGGRLAGVVDDGRDQARREPALIAAAELVGVDELVAQLRVLLFDEGREEVVPPIFPHCAAAPARAAPRSARPTAEPPAPTARPAPAPPGCRRRPAPSSRPGRRRAPARPFEDLVPTPLGADFVQRVQQQRIGFGCLHGDYPCSSCGRRKPSVVKPVRHSGPSGRVRP